MKGTNTLELNEATMIEAVQFWLDSQFTKPVTVTSVKGGNNITPTFEVRLEEPVGKPGDKS